MDNNKDASSPPMMEITNKPEMYGARIRHRSSPDRNSESPPKSPTKRLFAASRNNNNQSPRHTNNSIHRLLASKPIPFPLADISPTTNGSSISSKLATLLIGLVIGVWLGMIYIMYHLNTNTHPDNNSTTGGNYHSLHTIRKKHANRDVVTPHLLRRQQQQKHNLPKNYFQLSPPTSTNTQTTQQPKWSWPIIHIVTTRFMQEQGTLIHLAQSRLKLLEVITMPSLMKQSIHKHDTLIEDVYVNTKWENELDKIKKNAKKKKNQYAMDPLFLWIIKVDPNLDPSVIKELKAVLQPVRHFTFVVGSNTNFGIGAKSGGWRGGEAGLDILDAYDNGHVYFPDELLRSDNDEVDKFDTLRRAHEARNDRVVLETRIDADDAVNVDYFATLHDVATRFLVDRNVSGYDESKEEEEEDEDEHKTKGKRQPTAKWLYWCPHTHVQWNPSSSIDSPSDNPGMLQVFQMPMTCVTAGLTLGFAIGSKEEMVPRYPHTKVNSSFQFSFVHTMIWGQMFPLVIPSYTCETQDCVLICAGHMLWFHRLTNNS